MSNPIVESLQKPEKENLLEYTSTQYIIIGDNLDWGNTAKSLEKYFQEGLETKDGALGKVLEYSLFNIGLATDEQVDNISIESLKVGLFTTSIETPYRRVNIHVSRIDNMRLQLTSVLSFDEEKLRQVRDKDHCLLSYGEHKLFELPFFVWRHSVIIAEKIADLLGGKTETGNDFFDLVEEIEMDRSILKERNFFEIESDASVVKFTYKDYIDSQALNEFSHIFVIARTYRPELGWVKEIFPAALCRHDLIFYLQRLHTYAEIVDIVHCSDDGRHQTYHEQIKFKRKKVALPQSVSTTSEQGRKENNLLTEKIILAPMVRVSDLAFMKLINDLFGIRGITEMVAGSLLISPNLDSLPKAVFSINGLSSYTRLQMAENILDTTIAQLVIPSPLEDYSRYDRQSTVVYCLNDYVLPTFIKAGTLLKAIGIENININYCCTAPAVIREGGGAAGLQNLELASCIVSALNDLGLNVSAKILLQPAERCGDFDLEKTMKIAKVLEEAGLKELHIQAQSLRFEPFNHAISSEVASVLKIPVYTNGGIVTLTGESLIKLGNPASNYSIEEILNNYPNLAGVMVGRALIGSNVWSFLGLEPTPGQRLALGYQEIKYLAENYYGMNQVSLIFTKMRALHHLKNFPNAIVKESIAFKIHKAESIEKILSIFSSVLTGECLDPVDVTEYVRGVFKNQLRKLNIGKNL